MMSDKKVFAQNCYENGFMNEAEMSIYLEQFDLLTQGMSQEVDGIIYLRAQPDTCHARCQKRNRSEESSISLEYLQVSIYHSFVPDCPPKARRLAHYPR